MKLILYHIESTGTDPAANRPCALAALALDASTLEPLDAFFEPRLRLPVWDLPHPRALLANGRHLNTYYQSRFPAPGDALRAYAHWLGAQAEDAKPLLMGWNNRGFTDPFLSWEAFRSFVPPSPGQLWPRLDLSYAQHVLRSLYGADACGLPEAFHPGSGKPDNTLKGIARAAGFPRDLWRRLALPGPTFMGSTLATLHRVAQILHHHRPQEWHRICRFADPCVRDTWLQEQLVHGRPVIRVTSAFGRLRLRRVMPIGWERDELTPGNRGKPLLLDLEANPEETLQMNAAAILTLSRSAAYPMTEDDLAETGLTTAPADPQAQRLAADDGRLAIHRQRYHQEEKSASLDFPPRLREETRRAFHRFALDGKPEAALQDDLLAPYARLALLERSRLSDPETAWHELAQALSAPPPSSKAAGKGRRLSIPWTRQLLAAERRRATPLVLYLLQDYDRTLDRLEKDLTNHTGLYKTPSNLPSELPNVSSGKDTSFPQEQFST